MATETDTLLVKIAADTAQLRGELGKATTAMARAMQQMARDTEKLSSALTTVGNRIKQSIVGALSGITIGKIASFARETIEWADSVKSLADRLGISTGALQEMTFAGREANIAQAEMTKGMESFWAKFSEAATGKGRGVTALQALGIDVKEIKNAEQALDAFARKIKEFDRQSQLSIAKQFFGDDAAKFLDFLAAMDEGRKKARELGVTIDAELIRRGEALNKELEQIADVTLARMRGVTLEIAVGFADMLKSIGAMGPEAERVANRLADMLPVIGGFKALFEASREIRRAQPTQVNIPTLGDLAAAAAPGLDKAAREGRKRFSGDTAAASALEGFEKKIFAIRHQAAALQQELRFDKATAAFNKAVDDFADVGGKFRPTNDQIQRFTRSLKEIEALKPALAFKEMATHQDRLVQIVAAEVSGNRELVAVLEQRFALEDRLGRTLTEQEAARFDALARQKFQIDDHRKRIQDLQQGIAGALESGAAQMTDAFAAFFDKNRNGWEELRNVALNTLKAIAQEMLLVMAIRPLAQGASEGISKWIGIALGAIGAGVGSAAGGGAGGLAGGGVAGAVTRDSGGPVMAGMPYIVGEKRPELFVPDVSGTIMPRVPLGGGSVTLVGSDAGTVEIGLLKQALRQLGIRVNQIDAGFNARAVGAMVDARRRGGAAASVFG